MSRDTARSPFEIDGHRPAPQLAEELRAHVESLRAVGGIYHYVAACVESDHAHLLEKGKPERMEMMALDLFAGTGWGVACQRLGIDERGVEIMPEARATREAAGMKFAQWDDVWEVLRSADMDAPEFKATLLIASPPCQTFSVAGSGAGRRALNDVLALVDDGIYRFGGDALRRAAEARGLDDRTALVLTPLAYAYRHRPRFIALEQVPTVLPVWEAIASELRDFGYSVVFGNMQAEQYGVPQTRKRAILVARRDGVEARLPKPTHSKFYPRNPTKLDAGLKKWVSMAEVLGWGDDTQVVSAQSIAGGPRAVRTAEEPAFTVTQTSSRVLRSNYSTHGDPENRGERTGDQPAATITSKAGRMKWLMAGAGSTAVRTSQQRQRPLSEPASTITGGGSAAWVDPDSGQHIVRLTIEEAAALQTYPADFPLQGGSGKRFVQVGNAVPPLLAEAILATFIDRAEAQEGAAA